MCHAPYNTAARAIDIGKRKSGHESNRMMEGMRSSLMS
jgi:hypothetical protein